MNEIFCKGLLQAGGWIGKRESGNRETSQIGSTMVRRGSGGLALGASEKRRAIVGLWF